MKITPEIMLIDSPGVIPLKEGDELNKGIIGAIDVQKIKNPELVAHGIIKLFLKNDRKQLLEHYKIESRSTDPEIILDEISRMKGHLLKKGITDRQRSSVSIIKDWQEGVLRL